MIEGVCKLCRNKRVLCESHFMPAALYPKHVGKKMQFASRETGVSDTGTEMTAYALCSECERRLNEGGESEVLRAVAPKATKSYPLQERLHMIVPLQGPKDSVRLSGRELGFDMDKFAYFALSIVWRRAAMDWEAFDGTHYPKEPLGDFEEEIRRYLLGETPFPNDMAVIVIVSSDKISRDAWTAPYSDVFEKCINFWFLVRGIRFRVLMGYQMPALYRQASCTAPEKWLLYGDLSHRSDEITELFERGDHRKESTSTSE